jgi:lambda repressor-like predicted transcriptional regulator
MGRNSRYQNLIRDWTTRCDFSVLWCINEDRFFIVPATTDRGVILITSKKEDRANVIDVAAAKKMHASGMSMYAIAKEMGVSWPTVKEHLTNQRRKTRSESMIREVLQYEDRWDLLDVNAAVEGLTLTVPKPGEYPIEIDVSKEKI